MSALPDPPSCPGPGENQPPPPGLTDPACFTRADRGPASRIPGAESAGDFIDQYLLKQSLGEGNFGLVWHAVQEEPLRREVALKVIKPGSDSREVMARFESERQSLALMDHPNIASVFDAGTTLSGRPYFVMEFVKGRPVTTYCDQMQLTLHQRVELFIPMCQAVQHAHQKAILHRDLKPSNILVAEIDGKPLPKVIDFGIAKALGTSSGEMDGPSVHYQRRPHSSVYVVNPQYMSPEQAGNLADADTRSDIYALGVILYELLTGRIPMQEQEDLARPPGFEEWLRRVREHTPVRPSQAVLHPPGEATAAARRADPARLSRSLRGDLDWVVMKALEKDRNRRYGSALALAEDLRRHLRREPVSAAVPSWGYLTSRLVLRHRAIVSAGALVVGGLVAATLISHSQASRAIQAGERTQEALEQTRRSQAEALAHLAQAREVMDQFLHKIADDRRLAEVDLQALRQELLETALPFYQKYLAWQSGDPGFKIEQASALMRLGTLQFVVGEPRQAESTLRDSLAMLGSMPEAAHAEPKTRQLEAKVYQVLGAAMQQLGRPSESDAAFRKAIFIWEELAGRYPNEAIFATELSMSQGTLDLLLSRLTESPPRGMVPSPTAGYSSGVLALGPVDAETAFQKSLDYAGHLAASQPSTLSATASLVLSLRAHGLFLVHSGRWAEAETTLRRALEAQERLVRDSPGSQHCKIGLARTLNDLAHACSRQDRADEAAIAAAQTLEVLNKLVGLLPDDPEYRHTLATGSGNLAWLLAKAGKLPQAEEAFRKTVAMEQSLMAQNPEIPDYRLAHAEGLHGLGMVLWQRSSRKEGEETLLRSIKEKEDLVAAYPSLTDYRCSLSKTLCQLALLTHDTPEWLQARPLLQQALTVQTAAFKARPGNRHYAQVLVAARFILAQNHLKSGDHAPALIEIKAITQMTAQDPLALRKAIFLITEILPVVHTDEKMSSEMRYACVAECARLGLGWLQQFKAANSHNLPPGQLEGEETFLSGYLKGGYALAPAKAAPVPPPTALPPAPVPAAAARPPSSAAAPGDTMPVRFTYEYAFAEAGTRTWVREDNIWTETLPSGKQNVLYITGRITVDGITGSLLTRSNDGDLHVFLPHHPSKDQKMHLKFRRTSDGLWSQFGVMQNVDYAAP